MMSKKIKKMMIFAAALMLAGGMMFVGVMAMLKWDFKKLSTVEYQTKDYKISDAYRNISITANTADITFKRSEDSSCKVVCYEQTNLSHSVYVENETLTVDVNDSRKWYHYIGISFGSPKITVYLPEDKYGELTAKSSTGRFELPDGFEFDSIDLTVSTGDVSVSSDVLGALKINATTGYVSVGNMNAGSIDITTSTGKITVSRVNCAGSVSAAVSTGKSDISSLHCGSLSSTGDTGDIVLKNVTADGAFTIKRDTGYVEFDACDAAEIYVKTSTGSVKGTLLSDKIFFTKSSTGSISVPQTMSGGKCEITTSTGNIKMEIRK